MPATPKPVIRPSLVAQELESRQAVAKRAFIYSRTSSDRHKRRTSTRDQEIENRRTCEDYGWVVAGAFEDPDLSASRRAKKPRPDYEAMIEGLKRGECDVIVFWDSSRGTRDLEAYAQLRRLCLEYKVLLCYNGDVYDMSKASDRKRSAMDAVQDEFEADRIAARAQRTKRLSAERGAPTGRIPYGYRREYDPATGFLVGQVPDKATAKVVREAARRVLAGEALSAIAKDFQERGIPTAHGAKNGWQAPALRRILLNPAVVGRRVHQKKVVGKAEWKPILKDPAYRGLQRILLNPARRSQRDTAVKHLLSGIATCFCGGVLRPVRNNGNFNYVCKSAFCTGIKTDLLEGYVETALLGRLESPGFAQALRPRDGDSALREALAEVELLESELEQARELVGERKLSVVSLASIERKLEPQLAMAHERVNGISQPSALLGVAGPDARRVWETLGIPQRRAVVRAAVKVTLNRARVRGVKHIEADRITLEWLF